MEKGKKQNNSVGNINRIKIKPEEPSLRKDKSAITNIPSRSDSMAKVAIRKMVVRENAPKMITSKVVFTTDIELVRR